jgi:hypothetical protein
MPKKKKDCDAGDEDLIRQTEIYRYKPKKRYGGILRDVSQLIRFWVCSPEIISSSVTNLKAIGGLYDY